ELLAKRLEALRELVPNVTAIGLLANPNNPNTEPSVRELQVLARAGGWRLHVVAASTDSDLDAAFTTLVQQKVGAFLNATDGLFQKPARSHRGAGGAPCYARHLPRSRSCRSRRSDELWSAPHRFI